MSAGALEIGLVFAGGLAAGFVNVVAGGGSLISIPLLIFLGLPATSANGSARVAILVQGAAAMLSFQRRKQIAWRRIGPMLVPTIAGAVGGAFLAVHTDPGALESMLGIATLGAALLVALRPQRALAAATGRGRRWALALALVVAGFYGGFLQAGVGYLLLAAVAVAGGWGLVEANVAKVVLAAAYTPVVLGVFASASQIEPLYAAVLAVGSGLGGYLGAVCAVERGEPVIRVFLVLAALGAGIKLAFF